MQKSGLSKRLFSALIRQTPRGFPGALTPALSTPYLEDAADLPSLPACTAPSQPELRKVSRYISPDFDFGAITLSRL